MADAGIVRNRAKIEATINNARRHAELVKEFGGFPAYVWRFEPKTRPEGILPEAVAMSKDLRKRGWAFVGPTTVHSFMEAMGLVNYHVRGCAVGRECDTLRREFVRPA
jgi:DNA-3-methyladenine glycosylase I